MIRLSTVCRRLAAIGVVAATASCITSAGADSPCSRAIAETPRPTEKLRQLTDEPSTPRSLLQKRVRELTAVIGDLGNPRR